MESEPSASKPRKEGDPILEKEVFEEVREQYAHGVYALGLKRYFRAFNAFQTIIPLIANEPMVWVRAVEACLGAICFNKEIPTEPELVPIGIQEPIKLTIVDDPQLLQSDDIERLNVHGISMAYAEIAISLANCLVKEKEDPMLKRYILAQAAFIALKRGRYRLALIYGNDVINIPPDDTEFQRSVDEYVQMIMGQCAMKVGRYDSAMKIHEAIAEQYTKDANGEMPEMVQLSYYHRCIALCGQKKLEEAKTMFTRCLSQRCFSAEFFALGYYIHSSLDCVDDYAPRNSPLPTPYSPVSPTFSGYEEGKEDEDLRTETRFPFDEMGGPKTDDTQSSGSTGTENLESPEWPDPSDDESSAPMTSSLSPPVTSPAHPKFVFGECVQHRQHKNRYVPLAWLFSDYCSPVLPCSE